MDAKLSTNRKFKRMFANILSLFVILALAFPAAGGVSAAGAWYVAPSGDAGNSCQSPSAPCLTINGAIAKAASGDTIYVAQGVYTSTGPEVVLLNKNLTLSGGWNTDFTSQEGLSALDGQSARRGMVIEGDVTAYIEKFEITNGAGQSSGGGGGMMIGSNATVSLSDSLIHDIKSYGGISASYADLTLIRTTISNSIEQGILNYVGTLRMISSAVIGNTYGIVSNGETFIENSTISGNIHGGIAMDCNGNITISSSTVTKNHDFGLRTYWCNTAILQNTILAGNVDIAHPDCTGPLQSNGYNLIGDTTGCDFTPTTGDLTNINAELAPLRDNGGPTFTHALYLNSPALDAGNPAVPGGGGNACPATDQRGVVRPEGSACDIGAYEGSIPLAITPDPLAPTDIIKDRTPTYTWSNITGATIYRYQLWKGTTLVYTKVVASSACSATICTNAPLPVLGYWARYKWRVRAKVDGVWKPYSQFKSFTIVPNPKPGFWQGTATEFYVTPSRADVDNFAIYIQVNGCGNYKITYTPLVPIENGKFAFSGSFHANGKFSNATHAKGTLGLSSYYIPGCGYLSGGPFNWTAAWNNTSQPSLIEVEEAISVIAAPAPEVPSYFIAVDSDKR